MTHSWMSNSDYGGEEKNTRPKEHLNYGEKSQNMQGDLEQSERAETTESVDNPNINNDTKQRVIEALHQNQAIDSTNITVNIGENNRIELDGSVPERFMVEQAIKCVRDMGLWNIESHIRVYS